MPLASPTHPRANLARIPTTPPIHPSREAFYSVGYSPILVFDVPDLQTSLTRMLTLGARMDGAIQYSLDGKKVLFLHVCYVLIQNTLMTD